MNNTKFLIGLTGIAALGALSAAFGLSINSKPALKDVKADSTTYYLVGDFAEGYSDYGSLESWNFNQDNYPVVSGSSTPAIFHFKQWSAGDKKGDEFKFTPLGTWTGELGYSNLKGSAARCFSSNGTNIYTELSGDYAVYIDDGNLYIDFVENSSWKMFYTGTDSSKSDPAGTWNDDSSLSVTIGGSAATFSLNKNEEFKLKFKGKWFGALDWNVLGTDDNFDDKEYHYFRCFVKQGENIKVNFAGDYDLRLYVENHNLIWSITPHAQSLNTLFVLDLNGNLLVSANAHYYDDAKGISTGWPGLVMPKETGTTNVYKLELWDEFSNVIFNNNGNTENYDQQIVGHEGKCLILTWDYDDVAKKWSSTTWLSLNAAKFIDRYMKFEIAHENAGDGDGSCNSLGWYSAAKTAYEELSPSVKGEISTYTRVSDRLAAWATANHESFTITDGVGSFSAANYVGVSKLGSDSKVPFVISIALGALLLATAGGYFAIKRSKNR